VLLPVLLLAAVRQERPQRVRFDHLAERPQVGVGLLTFGVGEGLECLEVDLERAGRGAHRLRSVRRARADEFAGA
jgi:hypothetical protein